MSRNLIIQIEPWIDHQELDQLKRVVDSTFVTEGQLTKEFEEQTMQLTGSKYAISMTNGTVALFCGLKALGIGPGDEVIVPDLTFIASANSVIMAGAKPVFCDIKQDTFCIDLKSAEKKINKNTKAIMPVHLYGQSADMDEVLALAKKYNLKVIEDAAQGVGVKFKNKHVGTFGDIGILSYYGNKTITCGEGGMVITDNSELAQICYRLKNHGRDKKGIFVHDHIGYNFSFTEMQAAIGIAQMNKLSLIIKKKREIYNKYSTSLKNIEGFMPVKIDERTDPVFWFTSYLSDNVSKLEGFLRENMIQTRRFFYPLHLQTCYKNYGIHDENENNDIKVSTDIYNRGISLPSSYLLSNDDQEYVIEKILEFHK